MEASSIDAFAEAEALVDEFGARPPGSDAERRAAQHLAGRLEELGREAHLEGFSVWPQWATGYAINAGLAVVGGVLAVYSAALGTGIVLLALILTFLDAAGITPTTRRLLGRRASQNVVSFGERELPGALILVAHYDSGPARDRPVPPMFLAMVILLACCVARVGGMSGVALTVVQFLATVVLIVYVALMLDVALSPTSQGESDNASGVGVVLGLAERLDDLSYFAVHILFTGAQKARAQGMRSFLQTHRKQFSPGETIVVNLDAVGGGELRETKKEGPLLTVASHPQLVGNLDSEPFVNREASDGYAAASAGLPSVTLAGTSDRLEEDNLAEAEEACVRLIEELDGELS
ncbi:MAG: M28 family peptidase [Thermoleophilaceae bacterium]